METPSSGIMLHSILFVNLYHDITLFSIDIAKGCNEPRDQPQLFRVRYVQIKAFLDIIAMIIGCLFTGPAKCTHLSNRAVI